MEARSHRPSSLQPGSANSQHVKAEKTHFIKSDKGEDKSLEMAQTFTTDLVRRAIESCMNSNAFGPDKLSIFHLKNLGPRAIEYITVLFKFPVTTCQIPAIWKSSLIIPIPKPGRVGTSYQPISLLCAAAKVQMITYIAMGFNQRKPPDLTICVAVDLSTAFDTVCRNNRLSKSTDHSAPPPGHILSERNTSQDLLQRCKIDV